VPGNFFARAWGWLASPPPLSIAAPSAPAGLFLIGRSAIVVPYAGAGVRLPSPRRHPCSSALRGASAQPGLLIETTGPGWPSGNYRHRSCREVGAGRLHLGPWSIDDVACRRKTSAP